MSRDSRSQSGMTFPSGLKDAITYTRFVITDHLYFIIQTYVRKINRENSDLANKVSKTGASDITGTLQVNKITGTTSSDYRNANFFACSLTSQNPYSRAAYGFENMGQNAAILYLDTDNTLRITFNDGSMKVIAFSP